ncbi:MAG: N-acetyltransferase [Alphaproteobacteria bacterium]|nr:N-acetyltransferase [Alphaproteobacteria bacterium]
MRERVRFHHGSAREDFLSSEVRDNRAQHRFEIESDGATAFLSYERKQNAITFTHTEVPDSLGGRGMGSKLARAGLEAARREGLTVVAQCPFVAAYIEKHPEYQDLTAKG